MKHERDVKKNLRQMLVRMNMFYSNKLEQNEYANKITINKKSAGFLDRVKTVRNMIIVRLAV